MNLTRSILSASFAVCSLSAVGGIIGHTPIGVLERQADTIVVAEVVSVTSLPTRSTMSLRVIRALKGAAAGKDVLVAVTGPVLDSAKHIALGPRLWFLKDSSVLPRMSNLQGIDGFSLPAAGMTAYGQVANATTLRGIAIEVLTVRREGNLDIGTSRQVDQYLSTLPTAEQKEVHRMLSASADPGLLCWAKSGFWRTRADLEVCPTAPD